MLNPRTPWLTGALAAFTFSITTPANAALLYDLLDEAGTNIGSIEFTEAGILTSPNQVASFSYTQPNTGAIFTQPDIETVNLFVDDATWEVCFGSFSSGACDSLSPQALVGSSNGDDFGFGNLDSEFNSAFDFSVDADLRFVPQHVASEPTTLALLGLGLLGIGYARRRRLR